MDSEKKKIRSINPRKDANIFSVAFFAYTFGLFKRGFSNELTEDDLWCPLHQHKSKRLGDVLEMNWQKEICLAKKKNRNPRLYVALLKTFSPEFCWMGAAILVFEMASKVGQPIFLGMMLRYFQQNSSLTREAAVNCGIGFCILVFMYCFFNSHYLFTGFNLGVKMKTACCSLVYRKALRLSYAAMGKSSPGQMVNLLSNDVSRFDIVFRFHNYIWFAPVLLVILSYMTWLQSGWPGLIGISTIVVTSIPHIWLGRLTSAYRKLIAQKSDERLRLTEEIISGVRIIKMYAWEKPFTALISAVRMAELRQIKKTSYIRGFYLSFMLTNPRIACYSAMIGMAYIGSELTAEKVFVFAVLSQSLSFVLGSFVRCVTEGLETLVAIKRIEKFLLLEERNEKHLKQMKQTDNMEYVTDMKNISAKWDKTYKEETLSNLDIQLKKGSLTALIGPVGSGKSSLLHAILGEMPLSAGCCRREGTFSFACQEPWMFTGTVKQNIIFGNPYEEKRYNTVVHACALLPDFKSLVNGDASIIGEKGCLLSGGQKARINLARAVYSKADVYLLDDPLSAVDTHVGQHLFDECIMNFLREKTRVLVTHQLQYLRNADHIIVINNGRVEIQGSFLDITTSKLDYARFLEGNQSSDDSSDDADCVEMIEYFKDVRRKSHISYKGLEDSTTHEERKTCKDLAPNFAETSSKGTLKKSVYLEYFLSGSNYFAFYFMIFVLVLSQVAVSSADYWLSYWIKQNEKLRYSEMYNTYTTPSSETKNYSDMDIVIDGYNTPIISEERVNITEFCIYIYTALIVVMIVVSVLKVISFYGLSMKCSRDIHSQVFNSVIKTYVRFFDVNPTGRVMNRFSKDTGTMDEQLPKAMFDSAQYLFLILGALTLSVIVEYWCLFILAVLATIFFFVRKVYLKTSKDIKRLEGMTKSPVFVHLNATLQGLSTIRAFNAQNILTEEFDKHQDLYSSTCFMFNATSYAFVFYADVLLALFITLLTFIFLFIGDIYGSAVGFALSQLMSVTTFLQVGLRQSAEVENHMMSVERVLEYKYLDTEPNLETNHHNAAPPHWPAQGHIKLQDMSVKYSTVGSPVLKNINVTINSGEKVGIVGRTGAGKSSLIVALFRLAEVEGAVLIDGLDTRNLSLHDIRRNISIIPQDPFLFSGTLRKNLDPFNNYTDEELWNALEDVEMKEYVRYADGLDMKVADKGSNFSVGQKQLLCLARAILKQKKILVLDEATANVDPKTDMLIQKAIRVKFATCTVLTVAHRLNTVMDSDKIMVLERGRLIEFDHPHILLQNIGGIFYKLVHKTGHLDHLSRTAFQSYCSGSSRHKVVVMEELDSSQQSEL